MKTVLSFEYLRKYITLIAISFILLQFNCPVYAWVDNNNINRSDIVDSDHMGLDWTVQDGTEIAGNHTNIGNFKIESGDRVYVKASNGTNFGAVEIYAASITIDGILTANERGFGGGGGGGGSYGMGSWNGSRSMPVGSIGQGGTGTADGSNGNNAFEHWTSGHGNHTGFVVVRVVTVGEVLVALAEHNALIIPGMGKPGSLVLGVAMQLPVQTVILQLMNLC